MAGYSVLAPVIDDLMKWHLYIGYSRADIEMVRGLLLLMENNGLKCKLRSSLDVEEQSQTDNIKQGILFSHKCMLYISPDYLMDPKSQEEFKKAEKKMQLLGNSVIAIVKYNVKKEQLGGYEHFQLIYLKDGQTVQDCLTKSPYWDAILNDYELNPRLSLVPNENIGVGVAYTYYFSFLQIVIPGIWSNFVKEIQRPAAVKEPIEKIFLLKKMLIIIPKTLLSPLKLTDDSNFRRTGLSIKQCYDRAGKEKREYTIPIYAFTDNESGNVYYFVTDIPSCLYAIREAYDSKLCNMSRDDVFETRNDFVLTVKALLNHPEKENQSEFENQWELLLWPDDNEGNNQMKLSEFVSQQVASKELAVKLADILKEPIAGKPTQVTSDVPMPRSKQQTFAFAGGISAYPMYSERPSYALKNYPRGYCIIINNNTFTDPNSGCRSGAATEIEALKKLFGGLKFVVDAKENLTEKQMIDCLIEYQGRDHSESDAFVCCLLSHGEKGRIYATDRQIPVIKLMELFYDTNCLGLAGKPKLFFIGACQVKGADERIYERMQATSAGPNPPDGQLLSEAKKHIGDLVPNMDGLDLHDSERGGARGPYAQCEDRGDADIVRDLVPSGVDFIVSYACLPETEAWHDSSKGGLYVQALCKHLNQDLEIDVALRYVNQEVRDLLNTYTREGRVYSRQEPFHIIMPPQKFLFL